MKKPKPDFKLLKAEARRLYMEGISQKEIASRTKVSAVTVSNWCTAGGWKAERDTRLNSDKNRTENIGAIIDCLSEKKLSLIAAITEAEITGDRDRVQELREQSERLADEVSKWNKAKQGMQTEEKRRITLSVYLDIMDIIFQDLQVVRPDLYQESIDFQEEHIAKATKRFA